MKNPRANVVREALISLHTRRSSMGVPGESDPTVGRAGARFPSAKQLQRIAEADPEPEPTHRHKRRRRATEVGRSGARFPSARLLDDLAEPPEPAEPEPPPEPPPPPDPEPATELESLRYRVRPYVLTRGRTQAARHLALEALVTVQPQADWSDERLSAEHLSVGRLCAEPRSVAEIAALLALPLGVARVLVGDLAEAGLVQVHASLSTPDGRPDLDLMRRVLRGLHAL